MKDLVFKCIFSFHLIFSDRQTFKNTKQKKSKSFTGPEITVRDIFCTLQLGHHLKSKIFQYLICVYACECMCVSALLR